MNPIPKPDQMFRAEQNNNLNDNIVYVVLA